MSLNSASNLRLYVIKLKFITYLEWHDYFGAQRQEPFKQGMSLKLVQLNLPRNLFSFSDTTDFFTTPLNYHSKHIQFILTPS